MLVCMSVCSAVVFGMLMRCVAFFDATARHTLSELHTDVHIHTAVHMHIHTYIHTHTHTHTHARTRAY